MQCCVQPFLQFPTFLFLSWKRLWVERQRRKDKSGQGAVNALDMDMDGCSSGFDRVRSRPAKII
jgi:hypothetical protein